MNDDELATLVRGVLHEIYPAVDADQLHGNTPGMPDQTQRSRRPRPWISAVALAALVAALVISISLLTTGGRPQNHSPADTGSAASSSTLGSSTAPANVAPFVYLGPVSSTRNAAGGALLLQPPGAAKARLSPAAAYHSFCRIAVVNCAGHVAPAFMQLAVLTTSTTGHVTPGGTLRPAVNHQLSYVLSWHGVTCPMRGGPISSESASPFPTPQSCTETDAVDANTGQPNAGDYIAS